MKTLPVLLTATRRPIKEVMIGKTKWKMKWVNSVGKISKHQIKICVYVSWGRWSLLVEARVQETDETMTRSPVEYIFGTYLFRIHCSLKRRRKEETVHSKWMCFVRNREEQNSKPFYNLLFDVYWLRASLMRKRKNLPAKQETQVWSLGWKDSLEMKMTTNSISCLGTLKDREACWSTVYGVPKELNNLLTKERQHIDSYLWELAH